MATWATRRKAIYGGIVFLAIVLFVAIPAFVLFYHAPTCSDGTMNGAELGIDCGGSCQRLCQTAFRPAVISWTKYEKVAPGLYNLAAYIINPNTDGAVVNVPYKFTLFDKEGIMITEAVGSMTIPPHRDTMAFLGAVDVKKRTPARVIFEFTADPYWQKSHDTLDGISIGDMKYDEDATSSSLEVTLNNRALTAYTDIVVYVALYDRNKNAIGFSRTHIDQIDPGTSEIAPFTWPISHQGDVVSEEVYLVNQPVIDRAGIVQ